MLAAPSLLLPPKPAGHLSPTVSTKFRCRADSGQSTALGLDAQQQSVKPKQNPQEQKHQLQRQLSGVDVLRAIQRASAHKINKNRKKGWERVAEKGCRGKEDEEEESVGVDKGESFARDLCINGEWGARLDDLEKQLHHLMHS